MDGCWHDWCQNKAIKNAIVPARWADLFCLVLLVVNLGLALDAAGRAGHVAPSQAIANVSTRGDCGLVVGGHDRKWVKRGQSDSDDCTRPQGWQLAVEMEAWGE